MHACALKQHETTQAKAVKNEIKKNIKFAYEFAKNL